MRGVRQTITKKKARITDLEEPELEFWELPEYKAEFGDPKDTKTRIVKTNREEACPGLLRPQRTQGRLQGSQDTQRQLGARPPRE